MINFLTDIVLLNISDAKILIVHREISVGIDKIVNFVSNIARMLFAVVLYLHCPKKIPTLTKSQAQSVNIC
jgi:hypothetical protein